MALKFDGKYLKDGSTTLCRVEGDKIKEGFNRSTTLIKTSDAARKIGATSLSPTTAAIWYLFYRQINFNPKTAVFLLFKLPSLNNLI